MKDIVVIQSEMPLRAIIQHALLIVAILFLVTAFLSTFYVTVKNTIVDKTRHLISGVPATEGQLSTISYNKQSDFDGAYSNINITTFETFFSLTKPFSELIVENLSAVTEALEKISESDFSIDNIKNSLMPVAESAESRGQVLHPVRYALSGRDKSPDPFTIASILGKNETISRLQKAKQAIA